MKKSKHFSVKVSILLATILLVSIVATPIFAAEFKLRIACSHKPVSPWVQAAQYFEKELEAHANRPLKIGSFSAASNVTGIKSDTRGISTLLHEHGALAFWDYGAAAPYVDLDVAPVLDVGLDEHPSVAGTVNNLATLGALQALRGRPDRKKK